GIVPHLTLNQKRKPVLLQPRSKFAGGAVEELVAREEDECPASGPLDIRGEPREDCVFKLRGHGRWVRHRPKQVQFGLLAEVERASKLKGPRPREAESALRVSEPGLATGTQRRAAHDHRRALVVEVLLQSRADLDWGAREHDPVLSIPPRLDPVDLLREALSQPLRDGR